MSDASREEQFLALVEALRARNPELSPLAAAIVVAISKGLAADSLGFARLFGLGHALVLREIAMLCGPGAPVDISRRDSRTQRTYVKLTEKGEVLLERSRPFS